MRKKMIGMIRSVERVKKKSVSYYIDTDVPWLKQIVKCIVEEDASINTFLEKKKHYNASLLTDLTEKIDRQIFGILCRNWQGNENNQRIILV